jgi:uncharacterized protein
MELQHQFTVPAPIEETWAAFNDPERVAPCFPGATLTSVDGDEFTGAVKIKLGPIVMQYNGVGTYVERDEAARRAVIVAKGKDKRGNGTANATVTAQLSADGEGTAVHVTTDLAVTGKPAQFGRGVMQDVSDKLLLQFVACLQATLGAPEDTEVPAAEVPPAEVPVAEVPPAEVPAAEVPPAEVPVAEVPPAEVPVAEVPPAEVPVAEVPAAEVSPALVAAPATGAAPGNGAAPVTTTQGSATGGAAAPRTQAPAYRPAMAPAPAVDAELNLLRTVGKVLLTRYAARILGPLAFVVGYLLGRRSRR